MSARTETHRFLGASHKLWRVGILIVFALFLARNCQTQTPTTDEHVHLARGLAFYQGHAELLQGHPPLAGIVQALPAALSAKKLPPPRGQSLPAWASTLYDKDPKGQRANVVAGRVVTALFALLFLALFFERVRLRFGLAASVISSGSIALNTAVLAHAQLLTVDFAFGALALLLLLDVARLFETQKRSALISVAALCAALVCTKYVGLLFIFLLLWPALAFALFSKSVRYQNARAFVLQDIAIIVFSSLLALFGVHLLGGDFTQNAGEMGALLRIAPLPHNYIEGLAKALHHQGAGHLSYFQGEVSRHGFPLFYATLFAIKTPLALLLTALLSLLAIKKPKRDTAIVLAGALFSFAFCTISKIDIGYRHALLFIMAQSLLSAYGLAILFERSERAKRILFWPLTLSLVIGAFLAPDYLGDFNLLTGREHGHTLVITGEDWGQSTYRLGKEAKKKKYKPLLYKPASKGGEHELIRYRVNHKSASCKDAPKERTYVAIHRTHLYRHQECYAYLRNLKPISVVADHIEVYRYNPKRSVNKKPTQ